jgi:DNA-binding MarR family transcriptional regulator
MQQEARWLDDEEQRLWRTYLWTTQQLQEALDRQLRRDSGIPHTYFMILAMLSEAPERSLTMTRLAEMTRSSASRLSHAIARLEEAGWVRRFKRPNDRRTTIAELTDDGYAVVVASAPGHVEAVRQNLFDPLSREQMRQLRGILDAVEARLVEEAGLPETSPPPADPSQDS